MENNCLTSNAKMSDNEGIYERTLLIDEERKTKQLFWAQSGRIF